MQIAETKIISPRTLWGKVVIKLKESEQLALHIACGDIIDVDIEGDDFVIRSPEQYLCDILDKSTSKEQLSLIMQELGYNFHIRIVKLEKDSEQIAREVKVIEEFFNQPIRLI